ncbi:MAG TPA: arylsulfatase [Prolixibacteraceae bacterium]|nr:arylsulfatase [Prolixibacteraceae bacterium]
MLHKSLIVSGIGSFILFGACLDTSAKETRPNVIVVLSDDQGYADFSCHGNPVLKTPFLDKLYGESVRFGNFHVAPVCTPTRGQLMTGLDAMHNKACMVPSGRNIMRRDIQTMPEIFRENGYQTGIFGKWHLGDHYPDRPMDRGFQKCIWFKGWGLASEIEYDNDYYAVRYLDSLKISYSGKYCTDFWFSESIKWMDKMVDNKKPFFTYLALNTPHGPLDAPAEDREFYMKSGLERNMASFYGMIRNIDRNMAQLDQWLEMKKIKDNTLIVFMNDNGGTAGVKTYNAGMKGMKGTNDEGGHRAACFIRYPEGNFGKPRTVDYASEIQDLLPTFVDLFGLKTKSKFDGKSLKPMLTQENKKFGDRMFVVQYGGRIKPQKYYSCVVWDSWRLVENKGLFDLSTDPGQQVNLAEKFPEVLAKMRAFYENWWEGVEPEMENLIPLWIGSAKENPIMLTSNNWMGVDVDNRNVVANASGTPRGGEMKIEVLEAGSYLVELSRWPFHMDRRLTIAGPEKTFAETRLEPGKALPIAFGCFSLNNAEPMIAKSTSEATKISFEVKLAKGKNTIQSWFRDNNGNDLKGAYYVRLTKQN